MLIAADQSAAQESDLLTLEFPLHAWLKNVDSEMTEWISDHRKDTYYEMIYRMGALPEHDSFSTPTASCGEVFDAFLSAYGGVEKTTCSSGNTALHFAVMGRAPLLLVKCVFWTHEAANGIRNNAGQLPVEMIQELSDTDDAHITRRNQLVATFLQSKLDTPSSSVMSFALQMATLANENGLL